MLQKIFGHFFLTAPLIIKIVRESLVFAGFFNGQKVAFIYSLNGSYNFPNDKEIRAVFYQEKPRIIKDVRDLPVSFSFFLELEGICIEERSGVIQLLAVVNKTTIPYANSMLFPVQINNELSAVPFPVSDDFVVLFKNSFVRNKVRNYFLLIKRTVQIPFTDVVKVETRLNEENIVDYWIN